MLTLHHVLARTATLAALMCGVGLFSDFVRGVTDARARQCTVIAAVVFLGMHLGLRRRAWAADGVFVGAFAGAVLADVLAVARSWPPPMCMFLMFATAAAGATVFELRRPRHLEDPRGGKP